MLLDLRPLIRHREYRLLYIGQFASSFGSMITYVALPYQIYRLTHSSFAVGLLGIFQLVPLLATAFIGGALADSTDRRKLLAIAESGLALCSLILVANCQLRTFQAPILYAMAAMMSALVGIHRPALDALTPRLVDRDEIPAISALSSLRGNVAQIAGPALAGISIAGLGLPITFGFHALTCLVSLVSLALMRSVPQPEKGAVFSFKSVLEGMNYARSRQELVGTYVIDIVAMVFGMPTALFPAVSEWFGGAAALGWLYSAVPVGALAATLMSGYARKIQRHGAAIIIAAALWGVAITGFGLTRNYYFALLCLSLAGAADMVSALFRSIIWNETIPDKLRGRLASIEMVSYTSGPLLGNVESGMAAAAFGVPFSIISGGVFCVLGVGLCIPLLPKFWRYNAREFHARAERAMETVTP